MITAFGLLIPVFLAVLWAFIRSTPKVGTQGKVKRFNIFSIATAVVLSGGYGGYLRYRMLGGNDFAWWPVIASLSALAISTAVLLLAGLFRNLIYFRNRSG